MRPGVTCAVAAASVVAGCGAAGHPSTPARTKLAACVRLWSDAYGRQREELAILEHGALPDRGVFVTTNAPRGEPGELGTSRRVQIGPGRCVIGEQRNTLFVYAAGAWHMVNPTDSSDPALNVVYDADDHPNADANGEGAIALR